MKKACLLLCMVTLLATLSACSRPSHRYDDGYDAGYIDGYTEGHDNGYETGLEEGRAEVYSELVDDGLLKEAELVYLSNDGADTYHNFYCNLADHDKDTTKELAEAFGYVPCEECGGKGFHVYITAEEGG